MDHGKQEERKNALWMLPYLALYIITCFIGEVHPIMFVCYQIVAGLLLSGVVLKAFDRVKSPGAAAVFSLGVILIFVATGDANTWNVLPLIVIAVIAETVRALAKYSWTGDVISTAVMSFSTFGFYGQIWFNRAYTYECAIDEMPVGYADTLMGCSPAWAFPVVVMLGIAASVLISISRPEYLTLVNLWIRKGVAIHDFPAKRRGKGKVIVEKQKNVTSCND